LLNLIVQRNTEDEKKAIKEGRIPEDGTAKPAKLRQKDRDARSARPSRSGRPRAAPRRTAEQPDRAR
jgi:hypothetical protein